MHPLKTLGLIGGMSWESTLPYYRLINQTVAAERGGLHSARIVLVSVNFAEIAALQAQDRWDAAADLLIAHARALQQAGADALVVCTNTMHKVADALQAAVHIPLLHIADPVVQAAQRAGLTRLGLLGTRFTMEQPFLQDRLRQGGLDVIVPDQADRIEVHRIIFDELCQGRTLGESRAVYRGVIERLRQQGAQGVILGCTEISLLIGPADSPLPLLDSTELHARHAAHWALGWAE